MSLYMEEGGLLAERLPEGRVQPLSMSIWGWASQGLQRRGNTEEWAALTDGQKLHPFVCPWSGKTERTQQREALRGIFCHLLPGKGLEHTVACEKEVSVEEGALNGGERRVIRRDRTGLCGVAR